MIEAIEIVDVDSDPADIAVFEGWVDGKKEIAFRDTIIGQVQRAARDALDVLRLGEPVAPPRAVIESAAGDASADVGFSENDRDRIGPGKVLWSGRVLTLKKAG